MVICHLLIDSNVLIYQIEWFESKHSNQGWWCQNLHDSFSRNKSNLFRKTSTYNCDLKVFPSGGNQANIDRVKTSLCFCLLTFVCCQEWLSQFALITCKKNKNLFLPLNMTWLNWSHDPWHFSDIALAHETIFESFLDYENVKKKLVWVADTAKWVPAEDTDLTFSN